MAFTDSQVRQPKAKLDPQYIKTRCANGANLSYVEGWQRHLRGQPHLRLRCLGPQNSLNRLRVERSKRAGSRSCLHRQGADQRACRRDYYCAGGLRNGGRQSFNPGQAHELALKGAETDATKRALATFGNPFGLALYDREQLGVRKGRTDKVSPLVGPWVLRSPTGAEEASFDKPSEFAGALREAMSEANDIELLFAIWEQNVDTARALNRSLKQDALPKSGIAPQLVSHLKQCAIALVKPQKPPYGSDNRGLRSAKSIRPKVDKSVLTFGEPKRIRCKEHLRFVAEQPCLICGRSPSHAHHVRYAEPSGLGLKVSDEFTVPLCAIHHHHIHTTGKELEWWQERNINPLEIASRLWQQSRNRHPAERKTDLSEIVEETTPRL